MHGFPRLAALTLASIALITGGSACSTRLPDAVQSSTAEVDDSASAFPAKVEVAGQPPVTITQQPKRILSLSPSATETLYAIGAGKQVSAVDRDSATPPQAPRTDLTATSDIGAVTAQQPDLVIAPDSAGALADGLRAQGIPVLLTPVPPDLDAAYGQIETLGHATGHSDQAHALAERTRSQIDGIIASTPKPAGPTSFYHEVEPNGATTTSNTYLGGIYGSFGLTNIADRADGTTPRVSAQQVVRDRPDLVFLADGKCCQVTPDTAAARPSWAAVPAVRHHHVYELDGDLAGRWGPGLVDLARSVSNDVKNSQTAP